MTDHIILVEDVKKKSQNLEEFVYQKTQGGKKGLTEEEIKEIPLNQRMRAIRLLEIFQKNPGIRELKGGLEEPKKSEGITLSLEEAGEKWDDLTEKEKESFLRASSDMQTDLIEKQEKEKIDRLPDDIKTLVGLSQKDWDKLPGNAQELILRKMNFLEEQTREIPDVKDFDKLSEDKKEAILRELG